MDKFLLPENQPNPSEADDQPMEKDDLEAGLPASIQEAIAEFLQGEKEQALHLDCLSDELYGAINSNLWGGCITGEQADYRRNKYL